MVNAIWSFIINSSSTVVELLVKLVKMVVDDRGVTVPTKLTIVRTLHDNTQASFLTTEYDEPVPTGHSGCP